MAKRNKRNRQAYMEDLYAGVNTPPVTKNECLYKSVADVRKAFGLPVTLGAPKKTRLAMDSAYGGYDALFESLTSHAADLGQIPMTTFVGYGVLQQIAQNGMVRTCIQTVADDMTREWIAVIGGDNTPSESVDELQDLQDSKYNLRALFNAAFAQVGYMGGSLIFIDTGSEELDAPLVMDDKCTELIDGKHLRFVVVDPVNVSPGDYNSSDPLADDYMRPEVWWVLGKRVHASRLLTLYDNPPPMLLKPAYNFLGIPQAQILWDYVMHWNRARVEGVNILQKLNFMVFQTNVADAMDAGGIGMLDAKMQLVNRYRSNNSMFLCDTQEEVKNITLTISGVTDIIRQSLEFIASINRTPAVKLLGISPSGFNATGLSDIRNYYDHIRSKQEIYREAIQTCLNAIQLHEFKRLDESISFDFNELSSDDATVAAATAKTRVDMLAVLQEHDVISAEEVRQAVKQLPESGLSMLGDEPPEPMDGALQADPELAGTSFLDALLKPVGTEPKQTDGEKPKEETGVSNA